MWGEKMKDTILKHLPPIDNKATEKAVEAILFECLLFIKMDELDDDREATLTPAYSWREHGNTNVTSDQTAAIAIENASRHEALRHTHDRVQRALYKLTVLQRKIITAKYLTEFDRSDEESFFEVGCGRSTYYKHKPDAMYILAFFLRVYVIKL